MPPDRLPDGSTYQNPLEALLTIFDQKERRKKPIPVEQQDEQEEEAAKRKPDGENT